MSAFPFSYEEIEASFADLARTRSRQVVEARWEREFGVVRARRLAITAVWFALCSTLLLVVDFCLVGDVFELAVLLRLGLVVPFALAVAIAIRRGCSPAWREGLSAALMVLATTVATAVFLAGSLPTAAHYHYLIGLPILYGNMVQRPRYEAAAVASGVSLAIYGVALVLAGLPLPVVISAATETVVMVGFSLVAGYNVERELRRAFLRRVHSENVVDHLAHRNDELFELSQIDTLTGLANRRRLEARLSEAAAWSQRTGEPLALLMIDVDRFKQFNDRYGHPAGDLCLTRVARVACDQIRRNEGELGRFGGEEFLAILPGTDLHGATKVAERMREAVEALAIIHEDSHPAGVVGISIGCASGVIDADWTLDDLLRRADDALYAAKHRGRNRVYPRPPAEIGDEAARFHLDDPDDDLSADPEPHGNGVAA